MKTIWKYEIKVSDTQEIKMPRGAHILTVMIQGGFPCVWALVDPSEPLKLVDFCMVGTGHYLIEGCTPMNYVGSFMLSSGMLVFHLFADAPVGTP